MASRQQTMCPGVNDEPCRGAGGKPARTTAGSVCGHCARRRAAGSNRTAPRQGKQEAVSAADHAVDGPTPWVDRPVSLSELSAVLDVAGCGKQQPLAPLVEITQGPEGTSFVTVADLGDKDSPSLGALEITDPTAVADETRTVEVNGRELKDAIGANPAAERRTLTLSSIAIDDDGTITIGRAEAVGAGNEARLVADAQERIGQIREDAIAAGHSMQGFVDNIVRPQMREQGLNDYEKWAEEEKAYWRRQLPAMVPDSASDFDREIRDKYDRKVTELQQRAGEQAKRMQDQAIRDWAYANGHPWDMLKDLADPPDGIRESEATSKQRVGLGRAKEMLDSLGSVDWDPSAEAGAFRSELELVLPSAGTESGRYSLDNVHFGVIEGRNRITATNSYQLVSSSVAAPAALCKRPRLLPTRELGAFARASDEHLSKSENSAQLGTSMGTIREPDGKPQPGRDQRYRDRGVVAFHAGQLRVAMAATPTESYPQFSPLMRHAKDSRLITLSAQDVIEATGASKLRGAESPGDRISLSLQRTDSGTVTGLQWSAQLSISPERTGVARAARSSRASVPNDDAATKLSPQRLATALRFASAGSPNVELRGWPDGIDPLAIVPEGAPRSSQDIDRIALVMPMRH